MTAPATPLDECAAVRSVVATLKPSQPAARALTSTVQGGETPILTDLRGRGIRAFLREKQPGSDLRFAAAVACYFAFEAPESAKEAEINPIDLQNAARLSGRERLTRAIVARALNLHGGVIAWNFADSDSGLDGNARPSVDTTIACINDREFGAQAKATHPVVWGES